MSEKQYYVGSQGPYLYDDSDKHDDGSNVCAFKTNGRIQSTSTDDPGDNDLITKAQVGDVIAGALRAIQVANISNPVAELASLSMENSGALLLVYQTANNAIDQATLYFWDVSASAVTPPYVVQGNGGRWIALCGTFCGIPYVNKNSWMDVYQIGARAMFVGTNPDPARVPVIYGGMWSEAGYWVGPNRVIGQQQGKIPRPPQADTSLSPALLQVNSAKVTDVEALANIVNSIRGTVISILHALESHGLIAG